MDVRTLAREERADFADFLETLTPDQWDRPTLCAGWNVRSVVAHVVSYDELSGRQLAQRFVRAGLSLRRCNEIGLAEYRGRAPEELIGVLRRHPQPGRILGRFGGMIGFLDGLIHQQDIRRPLGLPRTIPAVRLRRALELSLRAPPIGVSRRLTGLRAVATDLDWTSGNGIEVRGPGEALLLALAGRRAAADDLTGPGLDVLISRTTAA
ncbi:maleylpyruvate isomerase family mycothiol-dependent enzyme [Amycolatopsis sp. AA4]|uniref:maleylpyruvate isomerase family mycothiol-dependent enzyme n=1 Tax=Actinomycetes TaxID=1760 RepID=UPI0001B56638|nr:MULTISPECIES: maleylpyruvate isomerase family mycothiol-dependent enzyme [Actinomycetes]ATY13694.1 maleylpyruvate isomerase family mycothiol-dependent enzyme [Amycolatopsis sp. AA4]